MNNHYFYVQHWQKGQANALSSNDYSCTIYDLGDFELHNEQRKSVFTYVRNHFADLLVYCLGSGSIRVPLFWQETTYRCVENVWDQAKFSAAAPDF